VSLVFWYEFASTYSYPAACRIERAAAAVGVAVTWKPFLLGPILAHQGFADSPFNLYPAKGRYMWRDLERLCAREGLAWQKPSEFPRNSLPAARIAVIGMTQHWGPAFSKAVFHANFAQDRNIAASEVLGEILHELGKSPGPILERAQSVEIKDALRAHTAEAERLGIFGAPTFQVGGEIFWGQDRLHDGIAWAAGMAKPGVTARL
jgi:2-hydroxychromene-2-carboxylate isomerase